MAGFDGAAQHFLLALSALFSIVNPIGSALIFREVTADRSHAERLEIAKRVGVYSAIVMLVSLWIGVYVLNFFGITLDALRIAGGLVVTVRAWDLLSAPERNEAHRQQQAAHAPGDEDVTFFPLTVPFTTGPGTMSVAIALGSNLPVERTSAISYGAAASLAAAVVAALIWIAYSFADKLVAWLGAARARVLGRLTAFLLVCIGVQITLSGAVAVLHEALKP